MLSGYLSPEGTFHNAPSYSHMSVAQQIAEHNNYYNPYELPEDTILSRGYICIRARDIYKACYSPTGEILNLTSVQQEWLQNHYEEFTSSQKLYCGNMIKNFGDWKKFRKEVLNKNYLEGVN